jgi:hypothetical protein
MAKEIVSQDAPFEIEALDAQFGGRRSSIMKADIDVNGTTTLTISAALTITGVLSTPGGISYTGALAGTTTVTAGTDVVATRDVTAGRDVTAVRKMTVNGALVMAGNPFRKLVAVGSNLAGDITFTGAKAGDLLLVAMNMTDNTDDTAKFEATVGANGKLAQTAAENLSTKTYLFLLIKQS